MCTVIRPIAQANMRLTSEVFYRAPRVPLIPDSSPPFDYLIHAYFEPPAADKNAIHRDAVVWANRGGGKTMLGAAATLLDLLFKPGIQVRVLGGSLEQSSKMHEHLLTLLDRPWFRDLLEGEPTQRRVALINGSRVQLLAGSQRSVRGVRVHKLRCDEVEEFDPQVWEAAQMVTRTGNCGGKRVHGAVEALSTMHRPFGLMSHITRGCATQAPGAPPTFQMDRAGRHRTVPGHTRLRCVRPLGRLPGSGPTGPRLHPGQRPGAAVATH